MTRQHGLELIVVPLSVLLPELDDLRHELFDPHLVQILLHESENRELSLEEHATELHELLEVVLARDGLHHDHVVGGEQLVPVEVVHLNLLAVDAIIVEYLLSQCKVNQGVTSLLLIVADILEFDVSMDIAKLVNDF